VANGGKLLMAKIETLIDPFNQSSLNTGLWTESLAGGATTTYGATGAQVNFPASTTSSTDGHITSNNTYDLTGSSVSVHVIASPSTGSTSSLLQVMTDANNYFWWIKQGTGFYAQRMKAGVGGSVINIGYNSVTHAWWKISESGGTITWWTSPDGVTWTSQATYVHGMTITAMNVRFQGSTFAIVSNPGIFKWNNLNIAPSNGAFFGFF
jgi:hypothetical protein